MKRLLLIPILVTYVVAAEPSLEGNWTIHINVLGNEADQSCTFTQKDKELTGSCTGERVAGSISGTIDANKVKWQLKRQEGGPIDYNGTVSADGKITGTVNVPEPGVNGEFRGYQSRLRGTLFFRVAFCSPQCEESVACGGGTAVLRKNCAREILAV